MEPVSKRPRMPDPGCPLVLLAAVALVACGPVPTTGGAGTGAAAPVPADLGPASLAAADLERGEALSLACQACHPFDRHAGHNIGPNLFGVFGRSAAALDDFAYSDALRAAGLVWTPAVLDAWLMDPAGFVPGSSMAFFGYRDAEDRRDLIAYLVATLGEAGPGP